MNRIGLNNGVGGSVEVLVSQDITRCGNEEFVVVSELAKSVVALVTEKSTDLSGIVAVVNHEDRIRVVADATGRIAADSTSTKLGGKHAVIAGQRDAVASPEFTGANFEFAVLDKFIVKNLFGIWNEWAIWSAGLIRRSVANLNVGVHGAEVVFSAAYRARPVSPESRRLAIGTQRSALDDDLCGGSLLGVISKPTPVVMAMLSTLFAFVAFAARVADRHREIGVEDLYLLTKRANMFAFFQGWGLTATEEMFLKEPLTNVCFAKATLDFFRTLHKYTVSKIAGKVNGILKNLNNSDFTLGFVCN